MTTRRTEADWTPEVVRRFWNRFAVQAEHESCYFSHQVGPALVRILELAGALRGRILDFGCGPGYLLRAICEQPGVRGYGVDYSPVSVEQTCKRVGPLASFGGARVLDAFPAPFDGDFFDAITCIETLEHVPSPALQPLLAEIARLLKPSGTALFTTPCDEDFDRAQAYCPFCDSEFHRMQHFRAFSPTEVREALHAAGFEVVFCAGVNLERFQTAPPRALIDYSARDVARAVYAGTRGALGDLAGRLVQAPFPHNRAFTARLSPGSNLVAVARKRLGRPGAAPAGR